MASRRPNLGEIDLNAESANGHYLRCGIAVAGGAARGLAGRGVAWMGAAGMARLINDHSHYRPLTQQ